MEKKYNLPEKDHSEDKSLATGYGVEKTLPALTEEELADCMTSEEFRDGVLAHIDKLFSRP